MNTTNLLTAAKAALRELSELHNNTMCRDFQLCPSAAAIRDLGREIGKAELESGFDLPNPENGKPCVICDRPITPYDSYGVGAGGHGHRYHWACVRREAATVGTGQPEAGQTREDLPPAASLPCPYCQRPTRISPWGERICDNPNCPTNTGRPSASELKPIRHRAPAFRLEAPLEAPVMVNPPIGTAWPAEIHAIADRLDDILGIPSEETLRAISQARDNQNAR